MNTAERTVTSQSHALLAKCRYLVIEREDVWRDYRSLAPSLRGMYEYAVHVSPYAPIS